MPVRPSFLGTRVFDNYDLTKLVTILERKNVFDGFENRDDDDDDNDDN